jgi:transposase-like protein
MGNKYFTDEQLEELLKNPYVKNASNKAITYTEEFKAYFVEEYEAGKTPSEILRHSGFDVSVLGRERIRNISRRFRNMSKREDGFSDMRKESSGRPSTKDLTSDEQIARLQHQVKYLKQENEFLKKINFLNQQAQWKHKQNHKKSSK